MSITEISENGENEKEPTPMLESNIIVNQRAAREGSTSVFAKYRDKHFKYRYDVSLHLSNIVGGVPFDPKVVEGWLKTKAGVDTDTEALADLVTATIAETQGGADLNEAVAAAVASRAQEKINGFKRLADQTLIIEGRQVKAMLIESANSLWPRSKWGPSGKGTRSYFAEHLFVEEDVLPLHEHESGLPVSEPAQVRTRFHAGFKGVRTMTREEICQDVTVSFTLKTDYNFSEEQIGTLFAHAEEQGLGAARSSGTGRFHVTKFEAVSA